MVKLRRCCLILATALASAAAQAQAIYDPFGFEGPIFSAGNIDGQDGWIDYSLGPSHVSIVDSSGDQRVRATHNEWGSFAVAARDQIHKLHSDEVLTLELAFRLDESWFAGMDADSNYMMTLNMEGITNSGYSTFGFGAVMFGSDFATFGGKAGYVLNDIPNFLEQELDDEWHQLGLSYDNGTGTLSGSLDGNIILTQSYAPGSFKELRVLSFGSIRAFGGEDTAFVEFDDFAATVSPSAVPEPGTLVALGLGALFFAKRRKSR